MGTLAARVRRGGPVAWRGRHRPDRDADAVVPEGSFDGVREALRRGTDGTVACAVAGRRLAREGVDLGTALDGLRETSAVATGREPSYAALHALGMAWADETLAYLHRVSCADPVTGLAGPAHLRARLAEVYRGAEHRGASASSSHALIVLDLPRTRDRGSLGGALAAATVGERIRLVFPGEDTLCRLGPTRFLVLTTRSALLGDDVADLRELLEPVGVTRVWIEGLPSSEDAAAALLDELARADH